MKMYQVDAFTDQLFAGNPAAILMLDEWLADDLMVSIAMENNLAETAYVKPHGDNANGEWDLRWFTPTMEVDFCGHATLATAHVLFTRYGAKGELVFHTKAGELRVKQAEGGYRMDFPCLSPEPLEVLPKEFAALFSQEPVSIFRKSKNIFVDLGRAEAVRSFVPDFEKIAALASASLVITGRGKRGNRQTLCRGFLLLPRAFQKTR